MAVWPQSDVTKLPEEAQALVCRMLDQDADLNEIRRAVQRLTGERVMLTALSYFAEHYTSRNQDHKEARTQTDNFVRLAGKKGVKVSELMRAILVETLLVARREKQFTKADLFKLDDAERKRREFELKQKQERKAARHEKKEPSHSSAGDCADSQERRSQTNSWLRPPRSSPTPCAPMTCSRALTESALWRSCSMPSTSQQRPQHFASRVTCRSKCRPRAAGRRV